jgi:CRP/FNR family nitrogen fixation transcriptional regulator
MFSNNVIGSDQPTRFTIVASDFVYPDLLGFHARGERVYGKDQRIFSEEDVATHFYEVATGAVRSCKYLGDGRRQIEAFSIAGDIFGLERGRTHRCSAEATKDARVIAHPRTRDVAASPGGKSPLHDITAQAFLSLERAQRHAILLGRKLAPERVAMFLLEMAERTRSDRYELPMSRTDIADYLGLTIETVSRTLSQFARDALIDLSPAHRDVVLLDRRSLLRLDQGYVV